jgi:shikimate dehydrogenase
MISLALIGKDISHSQSPKMYKKLLTKEHEYTLLDFKKESEIPSLEKIFSQHQGLSITSPYKRHFLDKVQMDESINPLNAINCIKKGPDGTFEATNTDFLAVQSILSKLEEKYGKLDVVLLGDGAMSFITQKILLKKNIQFKVFSRKTVDDLENLFLSSSSDGKTLLVINSCARTFVFQGQVPKDSIFWDFNYDFLPHKQRLSSLCQSYLDGIEMLELQAKFAIEFWNLS